MSNSFSTSSVIAKAMTQFLVLKSPIIKTANSDFVEDMMQQGYMTNGTINIKIPGYPDVEMGLSVTPTGIQDLVVPYTITTDNDLYNVTRELNLFEQKFDIRGGLRALTKPIRDAIVDNYAYPAFVKLESKLETTAATRMQQTFFYTPIDNITKLGSFNSYSNMSDVATMMDYLQLPGERTLMMNRTDMGAVATSMQNMYNERINSNITRTAILEPQTGPYAGFRVFASPQITKFTAGALANTSGYTVSAVASDGSTITITGVPSTTNKLVNAGDMISIPSVTLLNPLTGVVIPYQLVVKAAQDANGNGSGQVVVPLSFPLMASGEHKNVASLPSVGAAVMVYPSRYSNYAYTKSGLSAIPVPLGDIKGAENSDTSVGDKIPVKVVIQGAVTEFSNIVRTSLMCGIKPFAPYGLEIPSLA